MAVLRDIVARLGIDLDKRSFAEANRQVDKTVKGLKETPAAANAALASIGQFFGAAAIAFGGLKIVELGSDANETLNVLNAAFGENAQAVQNWASEFATGAGRSEFAMREMAGQLGSVLNPLMERNAGVASEMSTQFAGLAVDLGSFFNKSDDVALGALRSGLTGEAEALKQFGVVMNEATLAAFALSTGITKNVKDMSIAEKTALRYEFILDQTSLAQGDAAKTAAGWANATKGLLGALRDLGTRIGLAMLPAMEKLVAVGTSLVRGFVELEKGSNFIKAALIVLSAVATRAAIGIIIAWAPVIIPILKFAAILTIAALVLDDFLTFMDRGDSVIGHFIDQIFGPGSASAAVDNLFEAWDKLTFFWTDSVVPAMETVGSVIFDVAQGATEFWGRFFDSWGMWIGEAIRQMQPFIDLVGKVFDAVDKAGSDIGLSLAGGRLGVAAGDPRASLRGAQAQTQSIPRSEALASFNGGTSSTTINQSTTVQVQGSATASDAGRIAAATSNANASLTRRTFAALTQEAEGT